MTRSSTTFWIVFAAAVLAAAVLPFLLNVYYVKLACRIMIFGLATLGLSLVVVQGGMISLGHALYLGLGAYIAGVLSRHGISNAFIVMLVAAVGAGLVGSLLGAISLRASGIYFIFVTLAFAQMFFYLAQSLRAYGGDDGFSVDRRMEIWDGLTAASTPVIYFVTLVLLVVAVAAMRMVLAARFGRALTAVRDNEIRARSLGIDAYRCKLVAFVISAAMTGLAGALLANLVGYVSPNLFSWVVSGDLLVIAILGAGFTVGPIVGAAVFILFEHFLSGWTQHWMIIFGPLLVCWILFPIRGLQRVGAHA